MRFSYKFIKKLAPGNYSKEELAEKLNLFSFETVDLGGDILEIGISPNRFSDAASHIGIARETSVIFDCDFNDPSILKFKPDFSEPGLPSLSVKEKDLCPRYSATYAVNLKVGSSPEWIKEVLESCGLRPINNVVDIMNYVMLETGQPLHAFDADKLKGGIIVRKAKQGEKIETLDGIKIDLNPDVLVIADADIPLAIAGIKGGKSCEVSMKTKDILVEAASFNGTNIYKTSKKINLKTDASALFAHNLSPELVSRGMNRALQLLKEVAGAKIYKTVDFYPKKQTKKIISLDFKKLLRFIGFEIKKEKAEKILLKLGFIKDKKMWVAPVVRTDIDNFEDVAEEIVRFIGYGNLPAIPPSVSLNPSSEDEIVLLKDRVRNFLAAAGFNEIYNYSFLSEKEIGVSPREIFGIVKEMPLVNPVSSQFAYLRDSLAPVLHRNLKDNARFYGEVRVFEIGSIFGKDKSGNLKEILVLGAAASSKDSFFELKGLIDALFGRLGITDYLMPDLNLDSQILNSKEALRIETGNHEIIGYFGSYKGKGGAVMEINLEKLLKAVDEEKEYEPLAKYPSIIRDLSILVSRSVRVGEILAFLQEVSPKLIDDIDLVDFYEDEKLGDNRKSLTFRIVFRSDERTLTDQEADKEMAIINKVVEDRFDAEIR